MSLTVGIDASVVASSSGGTRTYALQLLDNLLEVRPDWRFVLYLRDGSEASRLGDAVERANVRVNVVRGRPNVWRVQARLAPALDRDGVQVFHSMGYFAPLRWRGPKVVTVHDLNVFTQARQWLRASTFLPWVDLVVETPLTLRAADRVITDSTASRDDIVRRFPSTAPKIRVIPLAADPYFSAVPDAAETAEARAIAGGRPYVLFVGILSPIKNIATLLRAYAASGLPARDVRLVLSGSDREGYGAVVRQDAQALGVSGKVDIAGFVSKAALRALYWNALCVVLPSFGEGFGLPVVEAMAAGVPIIAANRQSLPEVLGSSGRLFDPDDADELAGLLTRIAGDQTFREELARASRDGRDRFSWRKTAESTAQVYEEVVASTRR